MSGPGDLYAACRELLDAADAALATAPGGQLDRVYVSPGVPAIDCEQLTVHAGGPVDADTATLVPPLQPGHRVHDTGMVSLVQLTVTSCRCAPTLDNDQGPPDPAEMEQAAVLTLGDLWAIWNHVANEHRKGLLLANAGGTRELFFDPAIALATSGGFAGWQASFRTALGGYREP